MSVTNLIKQGQWFVKENKSVILTSAGVLGTISTGFLAFRAGKNATLICMEYDQRPKGYVNSQTVRDGRKTLELCWQEYVPPLVMGTLTVLCIVAANRVSSKRAAAMAAAFTISEQAMEEYRQKVVQKIGESKEGKIRDEIAQDRIDRMDSDQPVFIVGKDGVLWLDEWSQRPFKAGLEEVKKASNDLNYKMLGGWGASLNDFYNLLGIPTIPGGDDVGWNNEKRLELDIRTGQTVTSEPCFVLDFQSRPFHRYDKVQG